MGKFFDEVFLPEVWKKLVEAPADPDEDVKRLVKDTRDLGCRRFLGEQLEDRVKGYFSK